MTPGLTAQPRTLADLSPGEKACVDGITGADGLSQRLAELGFTAGQTVQLIRVAPLGDPLQIRIRGFDLAVRRREASRVILRDPPADRQ